MNAVSGSALCEKCMRVSSATPSRSPAALPVIRSATRLSAAWQECVEGWDMMQKFYENCASAVPPGREHFTCVIIAGTSPYHQICQRSAAILRMRVVPVHADVDWQLKCSNHSAPGLPGHRVGVMSGSHLAQGLGGAARVQYLFCPGAATR